LFGESQQKTNDAVRDDSRIREAFKGKEELLDEALRITNARVTAVIRRRLGGALEDEN